MTEDYVWYGTNEYNFGKLPDPPAYESTKCDQCATVIRMSEDEYSKLGKDYFCSDCIDKRLMQRAKETQNKSTCDDIDPPVCRLRIGIYRTYYRIADERGIVLAILHKKG